VRKVTKKGWERKLQALCREIVIKHDGGCVTCPIWAKIRPGFVGSDILQGGHLLTRGKKTIKYDLRNLFCQCKTCNYLHEERPEVLTSYAIKALGVEEYDKLVFIGKQAKPVKDWQLEELYNSLKAKLI
jgi:hypothetical protein